MFVKRRRLVAAPLFVNAALGAVLLFGMAACTKAKKATEDKGSAVFSVPATELPAIWSTGPLAGDVKSLSLSSGEAGLLAVAFDGGGLQLYNFEAEPVGQKSLFKLTDLAGGATAAIGERSFAVFPGLTEAGELKAYIFGQGLEAPAQVDLLSGEKRRVGGVCSGPGGTEGVMRLAYWTEIDAKRLMAGMVKINDGELSWEASEPTLTDFNISSCAYTSDTLVASPSAADAIGLNAGPMDAILFIEGGDRVTLSTDLGFSQSPINFRNGITINAPTKPAAIAALGSARATAMPNGMIVVGGETKGGKHEAVFIDPSSLTATAP